MLNSIKLSILSFIAIQSIAGHMEVMSPMPRSSRNNTELLDHERNYELIRPVNTFKCEAKKPKDRVTPIVAGKLVNFDFYGGAPHNGGSCQFGLSYNEKDFVVLQNYIGNCHLKMGTLYNATVPATASNGAAILGWFWINHTGNREFYMNCIDVKISGGSGAGVTGKRVAVANINGKIIPEGDDGTEARKLYEAAETITIKGK
jgi:hypothetical protein